MGKTIRRTFSSQRRRTQSLVEKNCENIFKTKKKFNLIYFRKNISNLFEDNNFYNNFTKDLKIMYPLLRLKKFLFSNSNVCSINKNSLPRYIVRDIENVEELIKVYEESKLILGFIMYDIFSDLDAYFNKINKYHKYENCCNINTSKDKDKISFKIINETFLSYFSVFINQIKKLSSISKKSKQEKFINENKLIFNEKVFNFVQILLWNEYLNFKSQEKCPVKSLFLTKPEVRWRNIVENKEIDFISFKIIHCLKCKSNYDDIHKSSKPMVSVF